MQVIDTKDESEDLIGKPKTNRFTVNIKNIDALLKKTLRYMIEA